jgi:hypothetical protein
MAITNTTLIANTAVTVFTATTQTVISSLYVCNYSVGNAAVDIHVIPGNAVSAGSSNIIYSNYLIGSSDTLVLDTERLILDASDVIVVVGNISSAVVTVSSFNM